MITKSNEIIDIGDKIHSIVFKRFVQANHPRKIEPKVLESYIKGENNLILKHGETIKKGSVVKIDPTSMVVELPGNGIKMERNDKVLAVFDHPCYNTIFALQTMVERRSFSEYWLRYLDPRFEKRYTFHLKNEPEFLHVPNGIYNLIENKEGQLTRQAIVDKVNQEEKIIISDTIYNGSNLRVLNKENPPLITDNIHPDYRRLLERTFKKASFKNISLGGICIVVDDEPYENQGLILVKVEMPSIKSDSSTIVCNPLKLHLLGSIRGISKIGKRYGIHLAFLKRLDAHLADSHFSVAEKHYSHIKKPL
jgi:hypothetical protein